MLAALRASLPQRHDSNPEIVADGIALTRLLSNLAVSLASEPPERVADTLAQGLGAVAESAGMDLCSMWHSHEGGSELAHSFRWSAPGYEPLPSGGSLRDSFPQLESELRAHGAQWFDSLRDVAAAPEREALARGCVRSLALLPLTAHGRLLGAIAFASLRGEREWDPMLRQRLRLVASVLVLALAPRRAGSASPARALTSPAPTFVHDRVVRPHIADESDAARHALQVVDSVAPTLATVLLTGETGTGKEVFAQAIHDRSPRRDRPMVRVNCAAIPAALIESELFGRERGAYTGALSRQIGRFELAHGGTLFLDEIGDLPLESQVKLLRAIQDRVVERLGGTDPIHVDVRLIAATNRDLEAAVAARTFREDLYYRLNVFPIVVPPLRERLRDIPVLVWSFVEEFARASGKRVDSVEPESLAALQRHAWPGNVRELRNLVERAVILARGPRLVIDLPHGANQARERSGTLAEAQVEHIRAVLEQVGWRVRGTGGAAELLGMKPTTLDSRMVKLGIRRPTRADA